MKAELVVPRAEAEAQLAELRETGEKLLNSTATYEQLPGLTDDINVWADRAIETLERMFTNDVEAARLKSARFMSDPSGYEIAYDTDAARAYVDSCTAGLLRVLRSLAERLHLISERGSRPTKRAAQGTKNTSEVFIVHGHDSALLASVRDTVGRVKLTPIILHEQANQGATVVEKFEKHSDVGYAIVLLTADDIGASKLKPTELRPRARQNAIFELGYFVAGLSRNRVCAIVDPGIELPSDLAGVVTLPSNDWKFDLIRELKTAGYDVDANLLL